MKKVVLAGFMVMLVMMGMGTFAGASIMPNGDPFITHSWNQEFLESGVGSFNKVEVFMTSAGNTFASPVIYSFSDSSWVSSFNGTTVGAGTGNSVASLYFDIHFSGDPSEALSFIFLAYNGSTLVDEANAIWNGGWTIPGTYSGPDPSILNAEVPEPGTIVLLGVGLLCLAVCSRQLIIKDSR